MNENSLQDFHPVNETADELNCNAMPGLESLCQLSDLWVFGYGSILWNTGFKYDSKMVGYVKGFTRKFWQGNTTHRGTPESPGRVATLVQQFKSRVWGMAYHVKGAEPIKKALEHLGARECSLGGYTYRFTHFIPRTSDTFKSLSVLTFLACPASCLYLGPAPVSELAEQVARCRGASGTNAEYVIRLAQFVRANIPEDVDEHLFELERGVLERLDGRDWGQDCHQQVEVRLLGCSEGSGKDCSAVERSETWREIDGTRRTSNSTVIGILDNNDNVINSQMLSNDKSIKSISQNKTVEPVTNNNIEESKNDLKQICDSVRKLSYDESATFRYPQEWLHMEKNTQPLKTAEQSVRKAKYERERKQARRFTIFSFSSLDSTSKEHQILDGVYSRDDLNEIVAGHDSHIQCVRRHHSHMEKPSESRNMYSG